MKNTLVCDYFHNYGTITNMAFHNILLFSMVWQGIPGAEHRLVSRPLVLCSPSWPQRRCGSVYLHCGAEGYKALLNLLSRIAVVFLIQCQDLGYFVPTGGHKPFIEIIGEL